MNAAERYNPVKELIHKRTETFIVLLFLVALIVFASVKSPNFMTWRNMYNQIKGFLPLLMLTFGQCLVMTSMGGVDLSCGGVLSVINSYLAVYMTLQSGWVFPIIVAVLIGVGVGLLNGILVAKGRIQPLIATLAVNLAMEGLALLILPAPNTSLSANMDKRFLQMITKSAGGYMQLILFIAITVIFYLFLNKSRTGRIMTATGGNEFSAKCCNINTDRVKIVAFMISGLFTSIGAIILTAQNMSGDPTSGIEFPTKTITAAALGGTSLAGGKGSVVGCVIGVAILYIINNMLNLFGINFFYQYVIQGILLVAALALAAVRAGK